MVPGGELEGAIFEPKGEERLNNFDADCSFQDNLLPRDTLRCVLLRDPQNEVAPGSMNP